MFVFLDASIFMGGTRLSNKTSWQPMSCLSYAKVIFDCDLSQTYLSSNKILTICFVLQTIWAFDWRSGSKLFFCPAISLKKLAAVSLKKIFDLQV